MLCQVSCSAVKLKAIENSQFQNDVTKPIQAIRAVKGTRDLLPSETSVWQRVEEEARHVLAAYNFREIRTPVLEPTELFARSVGSDTDIVTKEMYTFEDHERPDLARRRDLIVTLQWDPQGSEYLAKLVDTFVTDFRGAMVRGEVPKIPENAQHLNTLEGLLNTLSGPVMRAGLPAGAAPQADAGRSAVKWKQATDALRALQLGDSLTLRPEATASVVRAYIGHSMFNDGLIHKLYYIASMFRRERPQRGRYRQFYQIGAEVLGSESPAVDVEVLEMLVEYLDRLGIRDFRLLLNSVGDSKCRPEYVKVLRRALEDVKAQMCTDCQRRAHTNPLRVFDCKVEADQPIIAKLPAILDHLCLECRQHFSSVTQRLEQREIRYEITPRLVRGLDYYTRTTFEITSGALGAQNSVLGGGRYDGLSELLGGPPTPGFGFAIGEDRLVLAAQQALLSQGVGGQVAPPDGQAVEVYIIWMGHDALKPAAELARRLRREGRRVELPYDLTRLKKAMGIANKLNARFAVIIGEAELATGRYQVKDMGTGQQEEVESDRITLYLRDRLAAPGEARPGSPIF